MKLSVLIPTYDYKCYTFVYDLHEQLERSGVEYEVIVIDDGSHDQVCAIANHKINELSHCRYIRNKVNVGRAINLNNLIQSAGGDWCLIMDCDAKVVRDDFISKYISSIRENPSVDIFSGDLVNPSVLPSPEVSLRYRYEKAAESKRTVERRNEYKFKRFCTFNILARKEVLLEVPFDSECTQYGYEDVLMGLDLEKHGKTILHIDNPLMHMGFDSNAVYLKKLETSLHTLYDIGERLQLYTGIGKTVDKLGRYHAKWAVRLVYSMTKPMLRSNLLGHNPNLHVLNFYKLGYFLSIR